MTVLTYNKLKLNEWNREFDWKQAKVKIKYWNNTQNFATKPNIEH